MSSVENGWRGAKTYAYMFISYLSQFEFALPLGRCYETTHVENLFFLFNGIDGFLLCTPTMSTIDGDNLCEGKGVT